MRDYYIYFMIVIYNENVCMNEAKNHTGRHSIHHSFIVDNDCIDAFIIGFGCRNEWKPHRIQFCPISKSNFCFVDDVKEY